MRRLAIVGFVLGAGCRPRVLVPPADVGSVTRVPPSQARAAVIEGWHGLRAGDLEAADAAARRALQLDPGAAGPLRLAAAVSLASGAPERARVQLDAALAVEPSCASCWRDRVGLTGLDADAAAAIRAGAPPESVVARLAGPPGPAALAAWGAQTDLDAAGLAARGRARLQAGDREAARSDLLSAVTAGFADPAVLDALVDVGEPLVALWAARGRAERRGLDAEATHRWFLLAWAHGTPAEQTAAAVSLGRHPASLFDPSASRSVGEAVAAGTPPPGLPAAAAWRMLAGGIPGATPHALEALPFPVGSAEVAAWLSAAVVLNASTERLFDHARVEPAVARVLVSHALQVGDPAQAAGLAPLGWEGGTAAGVASWPLQLESAGEVAAAAQLRASANPVGKAAVAVADRAPDAVSRVVGLAAEAVHLLPAALLGASKPCEAWEALERVSLDRLGDVPLLGDVGYAAWTAGCWSGNAPVRLRLAQALVPADGRVAHVLGLARVASGDVAVGQALLAQARWALPQDARLHSDLVRLQPASEDHR